MALVERRTEAGGDLSSIELVRKQASFLKDLEYKRLDVLGAGGNLSSEELVRKQADFITALVKNRIDVDERVIQGHLSPIYLVTLLKLYLNSRYLYEDLLEDVEVLNGGFASMLHCDLTENLALVRGIERKMRDKAEEMGIKTIGSVKC